MAKKILYILPSYNKFGGTPKKTMDLVEGSSNECYIYMWTNAYAKEFRGDFLQSGAQIFEGDYKRNIVKHIRSLLKIVDEYHIEVIQSQFFFGELLAGILKCLRPRVKLIIAFVGSLSPSKYKRFLLKLIYTRVDAFVYISEYVKREKEKTFPMLKVKKGVVIYNGTNKPASIGSPPEVEKGMVQIFCVSGLSEIKNVKVLIECAKILYQNKHTNIKFLIVGDGPEKELLEKTILKNGLSHNVELLGYQKNIGDLYKVIDIFVHPCYVEGFGIAVAEAMVEEKPIVVSNAGALPELIQDKKTGLLVDPFDPEQWAEAILSLVKDPDFAKQLASNAKKYAISEFSVKRFVDDYNKLYKSLFKSL